VKRTVVTLIALAALASGCAAEPAPVVTATPPPRAPANDDARWRLVRAPALGITVEMPGEPLERREVSEKKEGTFVEQAVWVTLGEKKPTFLVERFDLPGDDRPEDAKFFQNYRETMSKRLASFEVDREETVAGFAAMRMHGKEKDGDELIHRIVIVGRSVYSLTVQGPAGTLPRADAERFLASFTLALPWRVRVIEEARCTVAAPDAALSVTVRPGEKPGSNLSMQGYYLGGETGVMYAVMHSPVAAERLKSESVEDILQVAATGFGRAEGAQIDKLKPIVHDGRVGREVVVRLAGKMPFARTWLFLVGDQLFQVAVYAKAQEAIGDAGAQRFLESFRAGQAP
jgi:hypothetical protein